MQTASDPAPNNDWSDPLSEVPQLPSPGQRWTVRWKAAVIEAVPFATPVTSPSAFTVAIALFELVHVSVRPVIVLPNASLIVGVSCSVLPAFSAYVVGENVWMKFCEDLAFQSVAASPRAFLAILPLGQSHGQRKPCWGRR